MSEDAHEAANTPGVIAPPPLIYGGALAIGLLAKALSPAGFLPRPIARALGWPLTGGGLLLGLLSYRALRSAETNVSPYEPTTALVTEGPYRFTRNPLYLSLTLAYGGIAALANAPWAALLLPFVLLVMRRGVIHREERYLEREFGEEYLRYKARVRRWI
ncbi:MAG: isoprenylcysteine carboxylmethyltransferase family protein [Actinomycetota bacterium]|nr:isoprenylcysteine carboxylmethyltransferase family protein [Actinomycetota bacterium]